jgi:hypothetical protein
VTTSNADSMLPPEELQIWESLSSSEKEHVVAVLNDPDFGIPGHESEIIKRYPIVRVTDSTRAQLGAARAQSRRTAGVTAASVGTRSSWIRQTWKILGLTYAEVTTTIDYRYSRSNVTKVLACYGTSVSYVPFRSIDKTNWSSIGADKNANCRTRWTLSRPLHPTETGIQGLRVNGAGQILKTWTV